MWGGFFPTYHLRHAIYPLCFQQHSRYQRVTTCVFINISTSLPRFPWPSFVFNNIPASFLHFLKLLEFLHCLP